MAGWLAGWSDGWLIYNQATKPATIQTEEEDNKKLRLVHDIYDS